ncbi:T3SS effector HopA1 family protein [Nonomuraea sp. NPDC003707]
MTVLRLSPALVEALKDISVAPGGLGAAVGEWRLEAGSAVELRRLLASALYDRAHSGGNTSLPRTGRDPAFEKQLAAALPHDTTPVRARLVEAGRGVSAIVMIDGLRVRVDSAAYGEAVLNETARSETSRSELPLRLPAARQSLSPGFFLADGSAGGISGRPILRVYVHITEPEAAPRVWRGVLRRLEAASVPYRAKVGSTRQMFPRNDALVVYLGPDNWHAASHVMEASRRTAGVGATTSAFAHPVARGVGLAWDPKDRRPGMKGLSFGQHRAWIVAEALVAHAMRGDDRTRESALADALTAAGVDPVRPGRDLTSPPLPGFGL